MKMRKASAVTLRGAINCTAALRAENCRGLGLGVQGEAPPVGCVGRSEASPNSHALSPLSYRAAGRCAALIPKLNHSA